ncbi:MAG: hypothetical protein GWN58_43210, partial [Anaerolineae bacterium]|nr:hypothetical protein [Anaerolineae bacterium]
AETDQPLVGLNLEPYRTGTAPTLGEPLIGRWLTAAPMPIPEVGSDDCAAFAALVRGPVLADEAMTVEPSYRNRIEYVFPTLSASPEDEWRSTDDSTDVRIALDFDRPTMVDGSWAYVLALVNTNIKNAKLEAWDGAAWQTLGTYNGSSGHEG